MSNLSKSLLNCKIDSDKVASITKVSIVKTEQV